MFIFLKYKLEKKIVCFKLIFFFLKIIIKIKKKLKAKTSTGNKTSKKLNVIFFQLFVFCYLKLYS